MRERERKERTHLGERVPEKALWLLLLYVFSSTWATDIKALGASQLSGLGQTVLQLLGKSVLQL